MSIRRTRLSPEESRSAALAAARELLLDQGPQGVTLKAVAAKIGRTHANLLHHFGSAAGLQGELAKSIADSVNGSIAEAVERARAGETDARVIVDQCFDAFGKEGAGALAAWMILTGNRDALESFSPDTEDMTTIAQLRAALAEREAEIATLRASASWRFTEPLRRVKRRLSSARR